MLVRPAVLLPLLLAACSGNGDEVTPPIGETDDTDTTAPPEPTGPACDLNQQSGCGTQNSVVRGSVRLAEGVDVAPGGDLFISLNHEGYDGDFGGGYHIHVTLP
jgi:hypothetical protein